MRPSLFIVPLLLSACAASTARGPDAGPTQRAEIRPGFDPVLVERDLQASAAAKFGARLTEQALASQSFLLAKHYFGLPPPPVRQPDGSYRDPQPPVAMLVRRNGQWLAARAAGESDFDPLASEKAAALDQILGDQAFWNEPDHARPGCTDAGASLLWLKLPGRPALVRRGACGATARTERLIFLALDA